MYSHSAFTCESSLYFPESDKSSVTPLFRRPDVARLRRILDLNAEQFGMCFGVSPSLANGWINGTRKPIGPARKLLLLVERNPKLAEQLKSL